MGEKNERLPILKIQVISFLATSLELVKKSNFKIMNQIKQKSDLFENSFIAIKS